MFEVGDGTAIGADVGCYSVKADVDTLLEKIVGAYVDTFVDADV